MKEGRLSGCLHMLSKYEIEFQMENCKIERGIAEMPFSTLFFCRNHLTFTESNFDKISLQVANWAMKLVSRASRMSRGSGHEVSKCHRSCRVGSTTFHFSRVGSGRVKRFSNPTYACGGVGSRVFQISRVGSGRGGSIHEVFKMSRVGSSHDT